MNWKQRAIKERWQGVVITSDDHTTAMIEPQPFAPVAESGYANRKQRRRYMALYAPTTRRVRMKRT